MKMIPGIKKQGYIHRLKDLKLISLAQRILRGYIIEVFQHLNRFSIAAVIKRVI